MERFENKLKTQMKEPNNISYPDFDQMWHSIKQDELKNPDVNPTKNRLRKQKRFALVVGLAVALMVTPVYAALTYDWSTLLTHRAGIQSAFEQGLGQAIEQSITKEDITLTVQTAFMDDNRTFILYSLKAGESWNGKDIIFDHIGLKDQNGELIEGRYSTQWNDELGVFQGYFETDWIVKGQKADVQFVIENIQFIDDKKQTIPYNPKDTNTQNFTVQKDGIESVRIQAFEPTEDKTLLISSIMLSDTKMEKNSFAHIEAVNDLNTILEVEASVYGGPGEQGEYVNKQTFKTNALRAEGTQFQLVYNYPLATAKNTWNLNLALSKKQVENGSFKDVLKIAVPNVPNKTEISEMIVTPTQVRLVLHHEKTYPRLPYMDYQLDVGGTLLNGNMWDTRDPKKTELRFELEGIDITSLARQPITFIANHRVDEFNGHDKPISLTNISTTPQSLTTSIKGYPISWKYYMKDNNLYVESVSPDRKFGGVNQTFYLEGKEKNYGRPTIFGIFGDENNQSMDVYKNFDKKNIDIYISNYTIHNREAELRIPLKPGN